MEKLSPLIFDTFPPPILSENPLSYIICLLFAVVAASYSLKPKRQRYASAPVVGLHDATLAQARERFRTDARGLLREGYEKHKGRPFYVPSPLGERLMIPAKYVEELKTAPVDEVDFVGTFFEMFEGRYTTMGSRSTLHPRVAKKQLNQHLGDVLSPVGEEIKDAFEAHLPISRDWTEVAVADQFVQIVARVSSRMFGGTELSRHKEWVDSTINFAVDGFIGAQAIKKYPVFIRPLAQYWIPELSKIGQHHATAKRVIVPILKRREAQQTKPVDFLQWMLDSAQGEERQKEFIASIQLKLSFAAIHTSAAAPTQILYDLCAMPEYIRPLREEAEQVLAEFGTWNKQALLNLVKMDSFMKESQRFNPLLLITFERIITKNYTLTDGFFIPAGTTIGVPTQAISMDPEIYSDPTRFDGFRFSNIRSSTSKDPTTTTTEAAVTAVTASHSARLQYAASNLDSMAFGYGRHACPGRFFASNEIKMIMVYLLMNYEFKFPEGVCARPQSLSAETQFLPDHMARVMFRGRRGRGGEEDGE